MFAFSGNWWRQRRERKRAVKAAYDRLVREALSPVHYLDHGAIDTFDGRTSMVTVMTALACARLAGIGGPKAAELTEHLNAKVLDGFDAAFREKGVGDHSIARKVRGLAETHSGLGRALMDALKAGESAGDVDPLVPILVRNQVTDEEHAPGMAAMMRRLEAAFAVQPDAEILAGAFACGSVSDET